MISRSILRVVQKYGQNRYHKVKLTRLPGEQVVIMVQDHTTIQELYQHIQWREFIVASAFNHKLDEINIDEEIKQTAEQAKEAPFIPILLANDLFIYEVSGNKANILYGIQMLELSLTNNRHLPETVEEGILNLVNEWQQAKTVGQALSMPHMTSQEQLIEQKNEINETISKAVTNMKIMNQIKLANPVNSFVNKMSILMGTNWVFLYVLTFGYYGWDVGEPISYLSAVGVDLLAMLGWFDLEKRLTEQFEVNEGRYIGLLNLMAQKRSQKWLHCYHRRQIN